MTTIKKNATLYTVLENTPGYMPCNDNPFQSLSRRAANTAAADVAAELREDYFVSGTAASGGYWATPRTGEGSDINVSIGVVSLINLLSGDCAECMACGSYTTRTNIYSPEYHDNYCIVNQ